MDFSFYNLGAFFIKGNFFFFCWGLKRRLNSLKGWAGPDSESKVVIILAF